MELARREHRGNLVPMPVRLADLHPGEDYQGGLFPDGCPRTEAHVEQHRLAQCFDWRHHELLTHVADAGRVAGLS